MCHLRSVGLTVNTDTINFTQEKICFLGHVISYKGVTVDSKKVQGIRDFPHPKMQRGLLNSSEWLTITGNSFRTWQKLLLCLISLGKKANISLRWETAAGFWDAKGGHNIATGGTYGRFFLSVHRADCFREVLLQEAQTSPYFPQPSHTEWFYHILWSALCWAAGFMRSTSEVLATGL